MVVQHNLTAMNSNRMLGITTGAQAKSTEKLSSGYRINRAADDAAGLTISEKMRKQMRGLDRASTNAQDGVSAVQTAEGALTEVHSMLQRMNELANQSANGSNSESDRDAIQAEIEQLTTEIDRVAETTKFNETYLLKGNADGKKSDVTVNAHDAGIAGKLVDDGKTATFTVDSKLEEGDKITIAGKEYKIGSDATGKSVNDYAQKADTAVTDATVKTGDSITDASTGKTYTIVDKAVNAQGLFVQDKSAFTITHADGSTESYIVDDGTGGAGKLSAKDALDVATQALAAGEKVTLTKDASGADCNIEVVTALENTATNAEVSSATVAAAGGTVDDLKDAAAAIDAGFTLAAGDTVTLGGKTTTLTENAPKAASAVADVVSKLGEGDKVQITRDGQTNTLTVGDTTDAIKGTYTVADILSNIKDGDQVIFGIDTNHSAANAAATSAGISHGTPSAIGSDAYSVVGETSSSDDGVISKSKALEMIGEELAKASSIGTDTAATVKNNNDGTFTIEKGTVSVKDSLSFALHVGADADMTNKITVDISSMDAAGLGIKGLNVSDNNGASATYAIDAISDAIAKVSAQRSSLGAVQNRLEHTIANLDNVVENTTAAESRIRDTDMAEEMVNFSKNNILAQAGQSMLAQANQSNQGVLSLLG